MEILLRVNWTDTNQHFDVSVNLEASHTIEDVTKALVDYCDGDPREEHYLYSSTGDALYGALLASDLNLVSGDELYISRKPDYTLHKNPETDLRVAVVAGPDAGVSVPLREGRHHIGRSQMCELQLTDLQAADTHLHIERKPDRTLTIKPAALGNEIRVNGQVIEQETIIKVDDLIHFGTTALAVRGTARDPLKRANMFGYIPFHRAPYFPMPIVERVFKALSDVPKRPEPRRFQFIAAVVPLFGGIMMLSLIHI